ncbi:unnamed protein product [Gulo gulo]|uniref:Uncharacterized protein n=1 Tax=Gulo gulo TaxID=48420 RepID=A0A9X9QA08_GULGU|nr:unnamed protein product [Gulo gulo]
MPSVSPAPHAQRTHFLQDQQPGCAPGQAKHPPNASIRKART